MTESQQPENQLAEVGRYARRREADDHALVVAAMGCAWKLDRDEAGGFRLQVHERNREAVLRELEKFEAENAGREKKRAPRHFEKTPTVSLYVCAWVMGAFFLIQKIGPGWWEDAGIASSEAMMHRGEWWRALTALTLHGDFPHIAANLAAGLLFAAFVLPLLGTGWTWILIVASGATGNLLNAWAFRDIQHLSLGASTAVFGALGILTACQTLDAMRSTRAVRFWELILPLGAGLALLAYLGTNGQNTDVTAHLWGFLSGGCFGTLSTLVDLKKRTPLLFQHLLAAAAPATLAGAWLLAVRRIQ